MAEGVERLAAKGVAKSFGKAPALEDATLSVAAGEIHAIIGQNGAGKSTLMNILSGDLSPDKGELLLDGKPYAPRTPLEAQRAGVFMVHQELSLCLHLSVAENVLLGALPAKFGALDRAAMERTTRAVLAKLAPNKSIDPWERVADLPPASQQIIEIARAVAVPSCRMLILDEPTSSLSAEDTARLFEVLKDLRGQGITVLYLSHFLEEVKAIGDRFTVLRNGVTVKRGDVADATVDSLVEAMAGRPIERLFSRSERAAGDVVLELDALAGEKNPKRANLVVRRGEVVGIAGLLGAGRTELFRAVFGLDRVKSGTLKVMGFAGPRSPAERLASGAGLLSEDRKLEGLALRLTIADNMTMSRLEGMGPGPIVLADRQNAKTQPWIEKLSIKCRGPEQAVGELSGGNQQKVAIARLLHHGVDLFLLDEPTRGIDVESKAQIYALIDALAAEGKSVLMVSSYLPELLGTCDRIHVMSRGVLGPSHDARAVTEADLLREATGS